jgi:hypothetical protein
VDTAPGVLVIGLTGLGRARGEGVAGPPLAAAGGAGACVEAEVGVMGAWRYVCATS